MKTSIIYIIVAVAVVGGLAGFLVTRNKDGGMMNNSSSPMSMKELLAQGGSQKCTFAHNDDSVQSSGIVYFADGSMRGDFTSNMSGKQYESHMITDGQIAYVWMNGMSQGMKMSFGASLEGQQGQTQGVDPNQKLNYDCNRWSGDKSKFSAPSDVKFVDLNAMVGASSAPGASGASAYCAQCDALTDSSAKAQCRLALNCK